MDMVVVAEEHAFGDLQLEPLGGKSVSLSTIRTMVGSACDLNWIGDRLTATVMCCGHLAASAQAVRSTHSPISLIRPISSASGMNCAGLTGPCSGWSQRISASKPVTSSLEASTHGWIDHPQLAFLERDAQVQFHQLPLARGLVHLRREEAEAALAGGLGRVKREVGVAHQIVGRAVVIVRRDDATDAPIDTTVPLIV